MTMAGKLLILVCVVSAVLSARSDSTGIKLIEQRKLPEAQKFFRTAVDKDSRDAESRYYLALTLMMQQQLDDAEDEVDEAIDLNDTAAKYHLLRGQILGQRAMSANVISQGFLAPKIKNAFLRASELDPSSIEARAALFNYYVMAPGIMGGSEEKAFEQATAVVALHPLRGYLMLANYYVRVKKDSAEAERQIKKAIAAEPSKGNGYKQLGYFYMNQRRYSDAAIQMKKYIELDPKNPDSHDSFADVLKSEKKFDHAIDKYHDALALDKNFGPSIFSMAECFELKGEKKKAKETYQWFLTVEPSGRRADAANKKIKEL